MLAFARLLPNTVSSMFVLQFHLCLFYSFIYVCFTTGAEHLDLIFEYAELVLQKHPEDGLKVCTFVVPDIWLVCRMGATETS